MTQHQEPRPPSMAGRFRGFFPVVVDVETGGFNARTDAILEIAAVTLSMDEEGWVFPDETLFHHVTPFDGANIEQSALEFTGIDPYQPLRFAVSEQHALKDIVGTVRQKQKAHHCHRSVLVGHNAFFDRDFVKAGIERCGIKRDPFHPFSCLDTVSLAALAYGQTVLAKACGAAGLGFDPKEAHSALYDAEKTADLFCTITNRWQALGGWPPHGCAQEPGGGANTGENAD